MFPGAVACMPILFSRAEKCKATFHEIKDVFFLVSECCLIGVR